MKGWNASSPNFHQLTVAMQCLMLNPNNGTLISLSDIPFRLVLAVKSFDQYSNTPRYVQMMFSKTSFNKSEGLCV
jgi:hypothetical protein